MTIYGKHSSEGAEVSTLAESKTEGTSGGRKYLRRGLLFVLLPLLAVGGLAGVALAQSDDSDSDGSGDDDSGHVEGTDSDSDSGHAEVASHAEGVNHDEGNEHARESRSDALTDLLGVSGDEIRAALTEGSTLVEVAAANGVSEQELVDVLVQRLVANAQEHGEEVTEDRLAEVRAKILERVNTVVDTSEGVKRHGHKDGVGRQGGFAKSDALTGLFGVSGDEIRAALTEGSTLVEVAAANGVSEQELVDVLVQRLVANAQEHGKEVTEDQLAEVRAKILERVNTVVDTSGFGERRGHHRFGDNDSASSEAASAASQTQAA